MFRDRTVRRRVVLAGLTCLALAVSPAFADQVKLRSGTVYEGKILSLDGDYVVIDTDDVGRINIPRRDVDSYQRNGDASPTSVPTKGSAKAGEPAKPPSPAVEKGTPAEGDSPTETPPEELTEEDLARKRQEELDALSAAKRLRRMKRARIKRRTKPKAAKKPQEADATAGGGEKAPAGGDTKPPAGGDTKKPPTGETEQATGGDTKQPAGSGGGSTEGPAAQRSIDGTVLEEVPHGEHVVVFEPPQKFGERGAGIAIGRRTFAMMDVAGVAVARLSLPYSTGVQRMSVRLAEVKRHVHVQAPSDRKRMLEGVSRGDWLRMRLADESVVAGRLDSYSGGRLTVTAVDENGKADTQVIPEGGIVQLDGLLRNTTTTRELSELVDDEPIALTLWPDERELIGRLIRKDGGMLRLDIDEDGEIDLAVSIDAPIADVRRVPVKWRAKALETRMGRWVGITSSDLFDEARVDRTYRSQVDAITAYAISLATETGTVVVPFPEVKAIEPLESHEIAQLAEGTGHLGESEFACDMPVVPGDPAAKARGLDVSGGLSAITNGRKVTHVFATAPFEGEMYGVVIGEPVRAAMKTTDLRFDTVVVPVLRAGEFRPKEYISESLDAERVTLLVDAAGRVMAVELSLYD